MDGAVDSGTLNAKTEKPRDRNLEAFESGVGDGTRTHDNRNHNPGLYQLSYTHRLLQCLHRRDFEFYRNSAVCQESSKNIFRALARRRQRAFCEMPPGRIIPSGKGKALKTNGAAKRHIRTRYGTMRQEAWSDGKSARDGLRYPRRNEHDRTHTNGTEGKRSRSTAKRSSRFDPRQRRGRKGCRARAAFLGGVGRPF